MGSFFRIDPSEWEKTYCHGSRFRTYTAEQANGWWQDIRTGYRKIRWRERQLIEKRLFASVQEQDASLKYLRAAMESCSAIRPIKVMALKERQAFENLIAYLEGLRAINELLGGFVIRCLTKLANGEDLTQVRVPHAIGGTEEGEELRRLSTPATLRKLLAELTYPNEKERERRRLARKQSVALEALIKQLMQAAHHPHQLRRPPVEKRRTPALSTH